MNKNGIFAQKDLSAAFYKKKLGDKPFMFGACSIIIGIFNIGFIVFCIYRIALWLIANEDIMRNPRIIEGYQLPENVILTVRFIMISTLIGLLLGIIGLFKKKNNFFAVIGVLSNGLLFLICGLKYVF